MSSYRQLLLHIVFRTKDNRPVLKRENADAMFSYIAGIIKNKNCHLYQINGVEDHIHILTDLHPSVALADLVKEIKAYSSLWMRENEIYKGFEGWADGYGAFSCAYMDLGRLDEYVKEQAEHHRRKGFENEFRSLIMEAGLKIDERYFP